jgi:hypothetical protein
MRFSSWFKTNRSTIIIFLVGAFISCILGFVNKFPFLYPDTGTYIDSGYRGIVPNDRPIFYGLFVRHMSLSASLWFVVFAQALICCFLIFEVVGLFLKNTSKHIVYLVVVVVLSLFTGYSYNVSFIMPDIFCGISLLTLMLLWFNPSLSSFKKVLCALFFTFGLMVHLSNLIIVLLTLVIVTLVYFINRKKTVTLTITKRTFFMPHLLTALAFVLVPLCHFMFSGKFTFSQGSHVFMMNHLIETGVLEDYLEEACPQKKYKFCQYKDSMVFDFMWDEKSPLYKTGGWAANKKEYKAIVKDIYTQPNYFILLGFKSIEYTCKQFFTFTLEQGGGFGLNSPPGGQIDWHFTDAKKEFLNAKQQTHQLDPFLPKFSEYVLVLLSMVSLLLIALSNNWLKNNYPFVKYIIGLLFLFSLINSFVCSNLAVIDARYQSRIVWIFPLLASICIISVILQTPYFRIKKH